MSSIRIKDKESNKLDIRGAKELFEHGIRRQREPSPAPTKMSGSQMPGSKGSFSSFKQRFEQLTASAKNDTPPLIRKANSVDNVATTGRSSDSLKAASGSRAEKRWLQARTQIYEQLSNDKIKSSKRSKSDLDVCEISTSAKPTSDKKLGNKEERRGEKMEVVPITDRINKFKCPSSSNTISIDTKKLQGDSSPSLKDKKTVVRDLKETYSKTLPSSTTKDTLSRSDMSNRSSRFGPKHQAEHTKALSTAPATAGGEKGESGKYNRKGGATPNHSTSKDDYNNNNDKNNKTNSNNHSSKKIVRTIHEVTDHVAARTFMEELITAIDNEQHIPMKQLIDLFEKMKQDNNSMRDSLEKLRTQLDKNDIDLLNKTLQAKLDETTERLRESQAQINELIAYRQALEASEQRCEELEELNQQHLQELEYVRLEMDELRDQYHDDEVHETIILQQRLDDMARSLRIIHFRLKKADARLQETEREKESLLEEIRILQGGTFTDEEIKRMQSLEGDLQSAKEVSVQLHMQLEKSEERQEKLEAEASQLREEIRKENLENERLRNNLQHLQEQMSNGIMAASTDSLQLPPALGILGRQGSANEVDTLKNNLEAAIERENDLKEQLKYAEEEAKMLRKRLRDIEHENDALTKQLRKLSQLAHSKSDQGVSMAMTSESIQAEVIQLENKELRNNNDKLHQHIDELQSQVKSLQVKLDLLQHEQNEGPMTHSKNSLYYETKFELMTKEIDHLRVQLREREKEYRDLLEVDGQSRRQLRRAITIDCDKVDQRKQIEIMKYDADILRDRLRQLEKDNDRLEKENRRYSIAAAGRQPSLEEENQQLNSRITSLERENTELLEQLHQQDLNEKQQKLLEEVERDNSRLVTELSYLRKSKPDLVSLVNDLQHSEEKILTYEDEIASLRNDMFKMENNLQDDINSLTMKNSILRSLLEAINQHEGVGSSSTVSSSNAGSVSNRQTNSRVDKVDMELDVEHDSLIAGHISRLPKDIQKQFCEKIECLEAQLKEERERARAAEGLLHQVKTAATKQAARS